MPNEKTLEERVSELESLDVKERVKTLEVAARRAARVKKKTLTGIVFPFPLYGCQVPDAEGVVFRAMLPCDGELISATIDVGAVESPEKPVTIRAEVMIDNDVYVRDFSLTKPRVGFNLDLPMLAGSKLTISLTSADKGLPIWIGMLFMPTISDAVVKKIIVEGRKDAEETGT